MSFSDQVGETLQRWHDTLLSPKLVVGQAQDPDPRKALVAHLVVLDGRPLADLFAALKRVLIEKNKAYGNSAFEPVRVFSSADPIEQVRVRIDDKLSRLARGSEAGEDTVLDLLGYLVILEIAEEPLLEDMKDAPTYADPKVPKMPRSLAPWGMLKL